MSNFMTDRIAGVFLLLLSIWYTLEATTFEVSMVADPLGPSAFPLLIGILLAICSIFLIIRPDQNPAWPQRSAWIKMGIIIGSFVLYANVIRPLGFIVATSLEMIVLSLVFNGPPLKAIISSVLFSLFLYILFSFALDLGLPRGIIPFF